MNAQDPTDTVILREFPDRETLASVLAEETLAALRESVAEGAPVTWAISGGSTPALLFARMEQEDFDWSRVHVALVDERWVPPAHPRSNEAFAARALASVFARGAQLVGLYDGSSSPAKAAPALDERYRKLPPVGACLLGMGSDGHTASLFPGAEGLEAAMAPEGGPWVAALRANKSEVTGDELDRVSLTVVALRSVNFPHLLITGQAKRDALQHALQQGLPIARVAAALPEPLNVFWAP